MKAVVALVVLALILALPSSGADARLCGRGDALGFVAIQDDPAYLVGTIPSSFTADSRYFVRRFNCRRGSAFVRRVRLGEYDVRFPGLSVRLALASAISEEGVTASVHPLGDGTVRISLRGPLAGDDVASRRDVAFSVVIY